MFMCAHCFLSASAILLCRGKKKGVKQLSFAEDHGNERPPRSKEGGLSVHFRCSGDRVRAAALAQLCRLLVTSDYPVT